MGVDLRPTNLIQCVNRKEFDFNEVEEITQVQRYFFVRRWIIYCVRFNCLHFIRSAHRRSPAPAAWPMPSWREDVAPVNKLVAPIETDEDSIIYADDNSPRLGQPGSGEAVPTNGGSPPGLDPNAPQQMPSHFDIDSLPTTQPHPDPAYELRTMLAAAPLSQQKSILKEKIMAKLLPLIPLNVEAREVFTNHLMKEDNLYVVELICNPTKLATALEHLQLISRAEAAEEATKRAVALAAHDRQVKAEEIEAKAQQNLIALEAKLRTEFQQQAAQSQAQVQKVLIEKDMQIQNQRAEYEATVQTARNDLLKHINSSDSLQQAQE